MPHEYDTWLGVGHTVPTGDPPEPYADDTKLCCMIVLPPIETPDVFTLEASPGRTIHFYSLVPLYEEEMNLKLARGTDALLDRWEKHGIGAVVDPRRTNVGLRKKWLGLF
jgi:hypothetical protein